MLGSRMIQLSDTDTFSALIEVAPDYVPNYLSSENIDNKTYTERMKQVARVLRCQVTGADVLKLQADPKVLVIEDSKRSLYSI